MLDKHPPPAAVALLLAAGVGYLMGRGQSNRPSLVSSPATSLTNPRHTILDELTAAETRAVAAYVVSKMPGVKTTMFPDGTTSGDFISGTSAIELIMPDKAAALAYIAGGEENRPS